MQNSDLGKEIEYSIVNKIIIVLARRGSGKTVLVNELVKKELHKFHTVYLFSPTEKINRQFKEVVKDNYVFETWDERFIEKLFQAIEKKNSNKTKEEQSKILFILDDLISDCNLHDSKMLKKLATRGRHLNITVIIIIQHCNSLSPLLRNNASTIFISNLNFESVESLSHSFCMGKGMTYKKFVNLYEKVCVDYQFLVINNETTRTNEMSEVYSSMRVRL
jgi:archaellum biogenesis ATPase FlaH